MKKEFILSLKKLNFIVLKKIAQKRGYGVGGNRDTVDIDEMEALLEKIQTRTSIKKLILINGLVILITILVMGILLNRHLKFITF